MIIYLSIMRKLCAVLTHEEQGEECVITSRRETLFWRDALVWKQEIILSGKINTIKRLLGETLCN